MCVTRLGKCIHCIVVVYSKKAPYYTFHVIGAIPVTCALTMAGDRLCIPMHLAITYCCICTFASTGDWWWWWWRWQIAVGSSNDACMETICSSMGWHTCQSHSFPLRRISLWSLPPPWWCWRSIFVFAASLSDALLGSGGMLKRGCVWHLILDCVGSDSDDYPQFWQFLDRDRSWLLINLQFI